MFFISPYTFVAYGLFRTISGSRVYVGMIVGRKVIYFFFISDDFCKVFDVSRKIFH